MHNTGFAFNLSGMSVCNKNMWDVAGVLVLQSLITVWGGGGKELLQLHYIRYKTFFSFKGRHMRESEDLAQRRRWQLTNLSFPFTPAL